MNFTLGRALIVLASFMAISCSEGIPKFGELNPGTGRKVQVNHGHFRISPASGTAANTNFKLQGRITHRSEAKTKTSLPSFHMQHVTQ